MARAAVPLVWKLISPIRDSAAATDRDAATLSWTRSASAIPAALAGSAREAAVSDTVTMLAPLANPAIPLSAVACAAEMVALPDRVTAAASASPAVSAGLSRLAAVSLTVSVWPPRIRRPPSADNSSAWAAVTVASPVRAMVVATSSPAQSSGRGPLPVTCSRLATLSEMAICAVPVPKPGRVVRDSA